VKILRPSALLALTALLGLALAGCPEPPNELDGSIGEVYDLSFDEVRIRKFLSTGELQIEYMRAPEEGSSKDIVAQVTVTTPEGGFPVDTDIKFAQVEGKVHRVAPGDDFPPIEQGTISFTAGANEIGDNTSGEFSVLFENKRTLRGRFDAELQEATTDT